MTTDEILNKLQELKPKLIEDGIVIVGLFGSYARGDNNSESDIDILYELKDAQEFARKYNGFGAFTKLQETKDFLEKVFNKKVDIADKNGLNEIGKKYILKDLKSV
ncbi:MAG: nucleotidyltransferase domain-containing protein [Campylobacterales bacterium]|nr:nucleotidyltransferase domain-containing protein [Campylobacterales bacterium]